ncbi:prolyl oligopeptidase family serine peptidase [Chryseobacterium sp. PBS4-4]|uniref:Prolyl oligopeptidase family serine peptidase n=1 Tax=Chryseobacterium edaphi TaxID=2976532 RepID=A0ABT2W8C8_9FLAO|nr:prolyl oligopeptidase family serine peptidase [Chryseobacterium edaphi]MCU7618468.1 prolyl oligopeptidase family serine peptidase [Chryseobacterium edaphi]
MDTNRKFMLLIIVLLLMLFHRYHAQSMNQSTETPPTTVPTYNDLRLSEKGRWLLSRTLYGQNSDTILVFDTRYPQKIHTKLVKRNVKQNFIGEQSILAQGSNTADLIRLHDLQTITFKGVKKNDVLTEANHFVILNDHHILTIYNCDAKKIKEVGDIEEYVTDEKTVVVALAKKGANYQLINIYGDIHKTIYTTTNTISAVPQFATGRYAAFTEKDASTGKIRAVLVNTKTSGLHFPLQDIFTDANFIKVTPIQDGRYFLIESEKREAPEKSFVEIRYGNDPYMRFRKKGIPQNKYWLYNTQNGTAQYFPSESNLDYISINSDRFFLTLQKVEQFDYRFAQPVFGIDLYDRQMNTSRKVADAVRNAEASVKGRFVVMRNELTMNWELLDTFSMTIKSLGQNLTNPFFSSDESMLIFESKDGVKVYDLPENKWKKTLLPGLQTTVVRNSSVNVFQKFGVSISCSRENLSAGIIIKAWDQKTNGLTYYRWDGKNIKEMVSAPKRYIKDFEMTDRASGFIYTIEESYAQSPQIFQYPVGKSDKKQCMTCQGLRLKEPEIKQEIISYKNSFGKDLKGVLYYPLMYQPTQKYPMIVKIYMEQSNASNHFLTDEESGDGFNPRVLLEKGYFVFLPDIVMDQRGSGLSALDCVHRSLDALQAVHSIDHNRIGLTGHSFGGYETNFIATHSTRFKAYLSSAGVSNLTSHYFTNNPHSAFNEYSRVENGQYEMKVPFAENKQLYLNNNPIYDAEKVNAPILLQAGLKDNNVLPSQTMEFYTALVRNRKDVIALFYSDQGHILEPESKAIKDFSRRAMEWWDYFLKDHKDVEWIHQQMKKDAL